jgi:energy-coupling factor transporter ATP-binding protein EcfA2
MRIDKIVITNSKRFSITGYKEIIYTPETAYQMILGTNGSGKSSLTEELNPLSADLKRTYNKGGGKKVFITHDVKYVLTSGMEFVNKHSFIRDGIELNDGGTSTVQDELVEKYFGLTKYIQDVILGKRRFSSFTANERKRWLQKIDKMDYTFVLSEFDKHSENLRNVKAALKLAVSRVKVDDNTLSQEEVTEYEKEISILTEDIQNISFRLTEYNNISLDSSVEARLHESNTNIEELLMEANFDGSVSLNNTTVKMNKLKRKLELVVEKLNQEQEKLEKAKKIKDVKSFTLTPLITELQTIKKTLTKLEGENPFEIKTDLIYDRIDSFNEMKDTITFLVEELGTFEDVESIDDEGLNYIKDNIVTMSSELTSIERDKLKMEMEISHIKEHESDDDVTCPNCSHQFKEKYDIKTLEELVAKHAEFEKMVLTKRSRLEAFELKQNRLDRRESIKNKIGDLLNNNMLKPFTFWMYEQIDFNLETKYKSILKGLDDTLILMNKFNSYNRTLLEYEKLDNTIESHKRSKEALENVGVNTDSVETLQESVDKLTTERNDINDDITILDKELTKLNKLNSLVGINRNLRKILLENAKKKVSIVELDLLADMKVNLEERLKSVRLIMSMNDKKLMEKEIEDKNINSLNLEKQTLEKLVAALSPNKGIIGDAIMSFMQLFLRKVNDIIASMWTYDLEVQSCSFNAKGNMSYEFPVRIDGVDNLKDISEGSKGMREIFDLAFSLVSMDCLGMGEYPIFLDEFASSMDTAHRERAFNLLHKIKGKHTQVFMISHFMEFYGGISNMDISVLSGKNINLDNISKYNEVIELKK